MVILALNQVLSKSLSDAPTVFDVIFDDIDIFVEDTNVQISFVLVNSTRITANAIEQDLNGQYSTVNLTEITTSFF